ncbi:peptidyl-prolyl cis-trans isomerase B (cyclophilin B) [Metabacillus crassostreae]|uniref:peptidylprolyl isomerase n=1 Tax=Metabacillus crassostreae TaxID=929098 RepID=UPI0019587A41|nr:peptidylprolyl isomerase [Metabacillus crassostreae]MBM7602232.1 peptidyl-prolyl cis-trans isomerase B (cyclophilin B) [Metabacillus crassostreae]
MKKFSKHYSILLLIFLFILTGCGTADNTTENNQSNNGSSKPAQKIEDNPIVTIEMENNDLIKMELYPNVAPNTVNNFISLVESGFYDGLIFHRVIPDFMIQGGDPDGVGTGGPGYTIKGEFEDNGFENSLKHERGIVSMARSQAPDSAGSQFFIMVADSSNLDGSYAAFGKVIEGMDAVDSIVNVKTDKQDKPKEDQKIKKVTVETFGIDYPEPKKAE